MSKTARKPIPVATAARAVTVPTCLLHAVAKWAHGDADRTIGAVAFRDDEMVATDGHRLVIVPCETNGHAFGLYRSHILAAVAAQNSLARDGMDPRVEHDLLEVEDHDGTHLTVADGPFGERMVDLWPVDGHVQIDLGAVRVVAAKVDISQYPDVRAVLNHGDDSASPDGYLLDARYLAAIEEVNTAHANYNSGVRVFKWGRLIGGVRDPLVLKSETGGDVRSHAATRRARVMSTELEIGRDFYKLRCEQLEQENADLQRELFEALQVVAAMSAERRAA